jgi:hypothetical protein
MADTNKISDVLESRERWGKRIVTMVLLALIAGTAFYFWGLIVPFIIDVVYNTLKLGALCVALGALLWVVFDPRMRTLALYGYRSLVRWITKQFTDIDPIGILNTYVARLKERLEEMEKAIGSLQGQRDQLSDFIAKNESERIHSLQRAAQAKKFLEKGGDNADMRGQMALSGRQAGRLETSNKTLTALLTRMDNLLRALKKMRDTSSVLEQDIEAEVKVRTEEYKMITKGFGAFKHAQKMMATGGPEKELYDETLNRLADNYHEKIGQIEYFMEVSKSMINGADLDNMAYEDSALAQLEKWEKEGANLSVPPTAGPNGPKIRVVNSAEEESSDSFDSMFNNDKDKTGQGKA